MLISMYGFVYALIVKRTLQRAFQSRTENGDGEAKRFA